MYRRCPSNSPQRHIKNRSGSSTSSRKKNRALNDQENQQPIIKQTQKRNSTSLNSSTSEDFFEDSFETSGSEECPKSENNCPVELPKKRWLREATQDRTLIKENKNSSQNWNKDKDMLVQKENLMRPTVLVRAKPAEEQVNQEWQGALALMELANSHTTTGVPLYTQL